MSATPTRIRRAGVAGAARVLARSFLDDPGWVHVFPEAATRVARTDRLLALTIRHGYVDLGESWVVDGDGAPAAAAIWAPPGQHALSVRTTIRMLPALAWQIGRRIPPALRLMRVMERGHPDEPHWYLAALGVDPDHQGRGHGARLLAPVLERCDATRTLAWLESANPRNHGFYRRMGFEVANQVTVPAGPTMTFFARRPR